MIAPMAITQPDTTGVGATDLQPLLDGRYASLRHQIREVLDRPQFAPPIAMPTAEAAAQAHRADRPGGVRGRGRGGAGGAIRDALDRLCDLHALCQVRRAPIARGVTTNVDPILA